MDKLLDRDYRLAEACLATGYKPDAVQMRISRGNFETLDSKPGTGKRRRYRIAEIWKLALMKVLMSAGFDEREAHRALSNITSRNRDWWRRDPNVPLILFISRDIDGTASVARKCRSQAELNTVVQDWALQRAQVLPAAADCASPTLLNVSKVLAPVDECLRSLPANED